MTRRWYHHLGDIGLLLLVLATLPVWIILCYVVLLSVRYDPWEEP
jgi:hypothetical protein